MSMSLEEMGQKISSATRVGKVVHIMKLIAASQIRKCEEAALASQHYSDTVSRALFALLYKGHYAALKEENGPSDSAIAIIFGTDQGLVGPFNDRIVEYAAPILRGYCEKTIFVFGSRLKGRLEEQGLTVEKCYPSLSSVTSISSAIRGVLVDLEPLLLRNHECELVLFHNHLSSLKKCEPVSTKMLPLDESWKAKLALNSWPTHQIPQVVDEKGGTLEEVLKEYMLVTLARTFAESMESENVSRLECMQRAEKNIEEVLSDLHLGFSLFRQSAIDAELFDVIAGFSALSNELGT